MQPVKQGEVYSEAQIRESGSLFVLVGLFLGTCLYARDQCVHTVSCIKLYMSINNCCLLFYAHNLI